jgi:hypothetical protein
MFGLRRLKRRGAEYQEAQHAQDRSSHVTSPRQSSTESV